jgi:hypothetical protein
MTSHSLAAGSSESGDARYQAIQVAPFEGPDWVPPFVGWWAQMLRATVQEDFQNPEEIVAAIGRLATDSRMKAVWDELTRRRRDQGRGFVHPTKWKGSFVLDVDPEELRQQEALGQLFLRACSLLWWCPPAVSPSQIEAVRRPLLDAAARCRDELQRAQALGLNDKRTRSDLQRLATLYEARAESLSLPKLQPHVVVIKRHTKRHTDEPYLRGYIATMVSCCRGLFGSPFYGTVATISSVAFQQPISEGKVRRLAAVP